MEQLLPVAHVLEHFDADDAIEALADRERIHVRGPHLEVVGTSRVDEPSLRRRVRHRHDARVGIAPRHPAGQRPPAAPQLENPLPVGQLGARGDQLEHRRLGIVQRRDPIGPVGARILEMFPQDLLEELRRQLVVLRVRPLGHQCDGAGRQRRTHGLLIAAAFGPQPLPQQAADPPALERLRDQPPLGEREGQGQQRQLSSAGEPRGRTRSSRAGRRDSRHRDSAGLVVRCRGCLSGGTGTAA